MATAIADTDRYAALLAAKADDRWEIDSAIPWHLPARPPRWLPRRVFVRALSQLYHGEVATAAACTRLAEEIAASQPLASACLRAQADDESRHAEVFARYLDRLGGPAPIDPPLAAALDLAAAPEMPPAAQTIAYNVVLEGEAVQILHAFARYVPCPLLGVIVHRTGRDEARHVAFGKRFVLSAMPAMVAEERNELARRIERIWSTCAPELAAAYAGPFGSWVGSGAAERRWQRHAKALTRLGVPVRYRDLAR